MSWTVADIKSRVRELTGRPSTSQLTEADLLAEINNYYRFTFPQEVTVREFEQFVTFSTVAGTNTKSISAIDSQIINVKAPVYVDGDEIYFTIDDQDFFNKYKSSSTDQSKPETVLLYDQTLYLGPTPDAVYEIKLNSTVKTPSAFTLDSETPQDEQWGEMIAYGTAIKMIQAIGDDSGANELIDIYTFLKSTVTTKQLQQMPVDARSAPRF